MSDDEELKVGVGDGGDGGEGEKRKRKRKRKKASDAVEVEAVDSRGMGGSNLNDEKTDSVVRPKDRTGQYTKKGTAVRGEDAGPQDGVYANDRTVYIEGLPFDRSEEDVEKFFSPCGVIVSLRLPKWQDSGRLRGYGHVEFGDKAGAKKAKDMDGTYMGKRFIAVTDCETPRMMRTNTGPAKERPIGCKTVFVKNLSYDCGEKDVREAMMVCGPIDNVRLSVWGHTGKLKGFGYVDFKREESTEIAVKKNGSLKILGRAVQCDYEGGKAKASFKSGPGGPRGT
jgi:nucleolin